MLLRSLSMVVSGLFLPLFMPLLALWLTITYDPFMMFFLSPAKTQMTLIVVSLATIVFPLINLVLLKKAGVITSYNLDNRNERLAPAITTLIYFTLGYFLIKKGELPLVIYSMYLGGLASVFIAMLISLKWKISLHAIGISGVLGGIYGLFKIHEFVNIPLMILLIICSGLVMMSRLELKAHTPAQVYVGFLVGFAIVYLSVVWGVVI
jgi:membrane-associated phospholipid phosphatase